MRRFNEISSGFFEGFTELDWQDVVVAGTNTLRAFFFI